MKLTEWVDNSELRCSDCFRMKIKTKQSSIREGRMNL